MNWLMPAAVASLTGTLLLSLVYFYLYTEDRQRYLAIWCASWALYSIRFCFLIFAVLFGKNRVFDLGYYEFNLIGGPLLVWGVSMFLSRSMSKVWLLSTSLLALWIPIAIWEDFSFFSLTFPAFTFLAFIYIWTGIAFLRTQNLQGLGKYFVGWTFIIWGIHKGDYPLLRQVTWFAPWGYSLGESFAVMAAIGMLLIYFEKVNAELLVNQDKLKESETKYRQLFQSSYDIFLFLDRGGNILDVNPRAEQLTGYPQSELRKMNIFQHLIVPENQPIIREVIKDLFEGRSRKYEERWRTKDGKIIYLDGLSVPRISHTGEILSTFCTLRDITEQKRVEDELRRSERVLREAEELGHTGSWEHNLRTGEIFNSEENARIYFGDDSSKGARFEDYADAVHPDDLAFVMGRHAQLLAQGGPSDIEFRVVWPDGSVHVLFGRATVVRDESGQAVRVYGTNLDITERKHAETALRQSQERYRLIVDTANEGICVLDEDNKITFVNAQMADMLGYESKEMIGRELESFIFKEDLPDYAHKNEMRRQGIAEHFERRWRRKDGEVVQTIVSATPILDAEHHFLGSFATILDITERKKLEEQLRQAQKIEAIGLLAGGVAHDFNNILTAIIGYSHLSLMKLPPNDPVRLNLEQILESSNRAAVLTQSLLAFSRRQPVKLAVIDLNLVIKEFEKFIQRLIREDIALETICTGGTLPVMADRGQFEHVIMNLATNARDAMPQGGKLLIETSNVGMDKEFIEAHGFGEVGEYALVSVSDTGMGMDEHTRSRIFEPFFTTKEQGKGTGLGLSMVYGTIKQHNGYLNVYSEPGKGTMVKIYLPRANPALIVDQIKTQNAIIRGGTETILVAEDDTAIRKLTVTVLRESGYTVIESVDGSDAVLKFKENKDSIKLVLLDGIMPMMNGKEALRAIKDILPNIKCLFMSGYAEDIFSKDGVSEDETDFILKPASPTALLVKIREVLDK
jgi:PAS domain S-box-containing protein